MTLSPKQQKLKDKLYAIWDNWEFVGGIGSLLKGDEEVQRMIDYIDSGDWVSFSDITLKALDIERNRLKYEEELFLLHDDTNNISFEDIDLNEIPPNTPEQIDSGEQPSCSDTTLTALEIEQKRLLGSKEFKQFEAIQEI